MREWYKWYYNSNNLPYYGSDEEYTFDNYELSYENIFRIGQENSIKSVKGKFSGAFNINGKELYIMKVIYNNPYTIVFWNDNTKTRCTCQKGDLYNKESALLLCIYKKLMNTGNVENLFSDWITEKGDEVVTVKDVRKKHKKDKVSD